MIGTEVFLRYTYYLVFGEGLDLRIPGEDIIDRLIIGEALYESLHLSGRILVGELFTLSIHAFYVRDEVIRDVTTLDFIYLTHHDSLGSLIGLEHLLVRIVVRHSLNDDTTGVTACIAIYTCKLYITLGVYLVQKTCLTVVKECANEIQDILIRITFLHARIDPCYHRVITEVIVFLTGQFNLRILGTSR